MNDDFSRVILIDKPAGMSSFGVVARARRKLSDEKFAKLRAENPAATRKMARVKVGHCGTLDPFATGLLIIVSGKNTKRAQDFAKKDKVYFAKFRLGETSTTGDPEGETAPVNFSREMPTRAEIEHKIESEFSGEITQIPPLYSAIKIGGQKAYNVARQAEKTHDEDNKKLADFRAKFEREKARQITVFSWEIVDYAWPILTSRIRVSSGTYIRSLAEDLGKSLGVGAFCSELRREKIADFDVKNAQILSQFWDD